MLQNILKKCDRYIHMQNIGAYCYIDNRYKSRFWRYELRFLMTSIICALCSSESLARQCCEPNETCISWTLYDSLTPAAITPRK